MTLKPDIKLIEEIDQYVSGKRRINVFDLIQHFYWRYGLMYFIEQLEIAEDKCKIRGSYTRPKNKNYTYRR